MGGGGVAAPGWDMHICPGRRQAGEKAWERTALTPNGAGWGIRPAPLIIAGPRRNMEDARLAA